MSKLSLRQENRALIGFVGIFWVVSSTFYNIVVCRAIVLLSGIWGVFFLLQHLFEVFVLMVHRECRKAQVYAYVSLGHFSRSQPFIRSFTLAWSKKCTATTMIQVSLQLWPKHCTSVGGPMKVIAFLHSSLWELQPPVKDSSLEQHILKSWIGPANSRIPDFLALVLRQMLQESMSVHLSIKTCHGKVKATPIPCWSTA